MNIQKNQQGNTRLVILIILVLAIALGYYLYIKMNSSSDSMIENTNNEQVMQKENTSEDNDSLVKTARPSILSGEYLLYSTATYNSSSDKKRVLFFHASWCPTCKAANAEFEVNLDKIPNNVVLLKTDYDSEISLKEKYGITYQHTFVLLDADGNALKKWAGGGINELITNTK